MRAVQQSCPASLCIGLRIIRLEGQQSCSASLRTVPPNGLQPPTVGCFLNCQLGLARCQRGLTKTACQLGLAKWCGTRPLLPELSARVFTGLSVWGPVWCGCFGVQCGAGALVWRPVWCGCVGVRCGAGAFACNCHPPPVISPRPHKAWVQLRTRALGPALSRPGRPHPARDADVARRPQNPGCPSYVHATGRVAPGREPGRHRG